MKEIATISKTFLIDRDQRKVRINYVGKGRMYGCLVPV